MEYGCFYGCEAGYVNESVCAKVASAVSSCLAPKAARRSKHMLFSCLDRECDPFAFVLSKRVSMLRRMLVMYPWLGEPVATILQNYLNRGFPGAALAPGEAASHVAPSMEAPGSSEAKAKYFSMGPIGHLLFSLLHHDLALGLGMGRCLSTVFDVLSCSHSSNLTPLALSSISKVAGEFVLYPFFLILSNCSCK